MGFFKKFILVRYTILLVAFLLPLVMFVAYSYYQYRLNSITDELVFRITSINDNTDNRYSEEWRWRHMNAEKDRKKLASDLRNELKYLSAIPFIICAEFEEPISKRIFGAWPVPQCSIIKKESTKVSSKLKNNSVFNLYYDHFYPSKIVNEEIVTIAFIISSIFLFLLSILILANYLIISRPVKMIINAINDYNKNHSDFNIKTKDMLGKTHNKEDEFGRIAQSMTSHVSASEKYLKEIKSQRAQMVRDLDDARKLQDHILPKVKDSSFPLGVMNKAAKGLSGDFYDFIHSDEGDCFFILADVSGKGVQASVVMVYALSIFRQEVMNSKDLKEIVKKINYGIATNFQGLFITAIVGSFNTVSKKVDFFNVGHNPPIYLSEKGDVELFSASSVPIGIMEELDSNLTKEEKDLSNGRIFFYTDGFPETIVNGKEIGEEGLIKKIKNSITSSAQETTNNVMKQEIFNPEKLADDMTFMTLGPLK
ncbi:MAG: Phosphoserine phosphatase RsbP [Alphaproteobacteria bacterium MarineAlpha5_Bin5]|nr:MAG: Phosphoserine phosphatase RsbP [Alphaproteobacteria bacterium MarineAlpha5_Bin5]PPR52472.1 MAG: Phosphoserine phosphatase RsbP [Alphaproteobacteria bacterium MarineAlpha5_Bin4]